MFPTNPQNAEIVERLAKALSEVPMGGTITYLDLKKIAGYDLRTKGRYLLTAARRRAEKELGACFECVREIGIQRLASDAIPGVGLDAIRKSRRAAKRGKARIDRVNSNSLSASARLAMNGYSAMLGTVILIADGRRATSIGAVADPAKPIPPRAILDMFRAEIDVRDGAKDSEGS